MAHAPLRHLIICIWNANGIKNKKPEIHEFVKQYKVDILLVTETKLRANDSFRLGNMICYRHDRPRQGGGTAIFLNPTLVHQEETLPPLRRLEATVVTVFTHIGKIAFVAAYQRPQEELLQQDLDNIFRSFNTVYLGGDLNAKDPLWNSRQQNRNGQLLNDMQDDLQVVVFGPTVPTYVPPFRRGTPDVLDIALIKGIDMDPGLVTKVDTSSDHNPVLGKLRRALKDLPGRPHRVTHWPQFQQYLNNSVNPMVPTDGKENIDKAVDYLTAKIREADRRATVVTYTAVRQQEELPPLLADLKHLKNLYRRRWQNTRDPRYRTEMRRLERELRRRLLDWRSERWEDKMESFLLQSRDEWQLVKTIRQKRSPRHPLATPHGLVHEPQAKAEIFVRTYEHQMTLLQEDLTVVEREHERTTRQLAERLLDEDDHTVPTLTTPSEVRALIRRLGPNKSPGPDQITNMHLKHLPRKPLVLLTRIYNGSLLSRYFPVAWKRAEVVPLPKPRKDLTQAPNYRPISLLSTLGKVFERVIKKRIEDPLIRHDVIRPEQYGFQKKLSAEVQVLRLTEYITTGFNLTQSTAAVFVDIEKAYDTVWIANLLQKLRRQTPIPLCYIRLLASFLSGRSIQVRVDGSRSRSREIHAGVPQGSVLSPLLFALYVNDMPKLPTVQLAQFADDTAFFTKGRRHDTNINRLQAQLDSLVRWCRLNKLKINPEKTVAVYFTKKRPDLRLNLRLSDRNIPWSPSVRYLGVTMDRGLFFHHHISDTRNKAAGMAKELFPFFFSRELPIRTKLRLYKQTVQSKILYGSTSWGVASQTQRHRLQVIQNRCLRWILRASRYTRIADLHQELGMSKLAALVRDKSRKIHTKLDLLRGTNQHLQDVGITVVRPWHRFRVPQAVMELD